MPSNPQRYGEYLPGRFQSSIIALTRALPKGWLALRVGYALRRLGLATLGKVVDVTVFGNRMRLHPRDNLCEKRVLFMPQFYDTVERQVLAEAMHKDFTFIDIGANVGIYSLFVASHAGPDSKVVSVEPDPEIHSRLRFNLRANVLDNVVPVAKAVGPDCGTLSFFIDRSNRGQNSLINSGGEEITVECTTLLQLFDDHGIDVPDAIKIDVEGAEMTVLEPFFAQAHSNRYPRLLILESPRRSGLSDAAQLALQHGYRLRAQTKLNVVLERSPTELAKAA